MINILKNKIETGEYSMPTSGASTVSKRKFSDTAMDGYSTGTSKRTSN